jgi:hypothetical protein
MEVEHKNEAFYFKNYNFLILMTRAHIMRLSEEMVFFVKLHH